MISDDLLGAIFLMPRGLVGRSTLSDVFLRDGNYLDNRLHVFGRHSNMYTQQALSTLCMNIFSLYGKLIDGSFRVLSTLSILHLTLTLVSVSTIFMCTITWLMPFLLCRSTILLLKQA